MIRFYSQILFRLTALANMLHSIFSPFLANMKTHNLLSSRQHNKKEAKITATTIPTNLECKRILTELWNKMAARLDKRICQGWTTKVATIKRLYYERKSHFTVIAKIEKYTRALKLLKEPNIPVLKSETKVVKRLEILGHVLIS
jgi:hypothetical protein